MGINNGQVPDSAFCSPAIQVIVPTIYQVISQVFCALHREFEDLHGGFVVSNGIVYFSI